MAETWVALLRGINVGGRSTVPMAGLRQLFEDAGFASVRTYINSGNVLFEGARPDGTALEAEIQRTFGVASTVVLRTAAELKKVAAARPFGADTSRTYVAFLAAKPDRDAKSRLATLEAGGDEFELRGRELYLRYPNGLGKATLTAARIERALRVPATVRNWNTVTKLVELAG
jgi:uncharacterized protein (DUF1697 family)